MNVWCVKWVDRSNEGNAIEGWCATFRNARPSEDAWSDYTACGHFVVMRGDSAKRQPTCADCKDRVARRRKQRRIV